MQVSVDRGALAEACARYGVTRLRAFGSVLTEAFDPQRSDVDFLVDFSADREDPFTDYFGLKESLETLTGRDVDLVCTDAIRNPFFRRRALAKTEELYAA